MNQYNYVIALFFIVCFCNGQTKNTYQLSEEIEKEFKQDINTRNYQHYAIDYMEIGAYKNMLRIDEQGVLQYKGLKKGTF
ncbi:hypothetical protein [Kordia sp.]|uniref:hypothetical protein n=1 Tax=Kordia sp. TaxID=1965332 RepID=UPI003D2ACFE5